MTLHESQFEYDGVPCTVTVVEEESKLKRLRWNTVIVETEEGDVRYVDRVTTSRYRSLLGWRDSRSYDLEEHVSDAIEDFKEKYKRVANLPEPISLSSKGI